MTIQAVAKIGTSYATKVIKGIQYERIKKVLPDGKVFSTLKETLKNGDSFSRTTLNGKTIVTTLKQSFIEPNSGNKSITTTVKRFMSNGDVIQTDKFINLNKNILSFMPNKPYLIIPVKSPFLTKETIVLKDFYPKGQYPEKRIFSCMVQESPVGISGTYFNNSANSRWKEMGFLKTKLWEKDGRIVPTKFYDKYIK